MVFRNREENKDLSGIYKITEIESGKVYVGQTKMQFKKRFWHHVWKLNNDLHDNEYLQRSWNKHGENNFIFEVLKVLDKDVDMNDYEVNFIKDLNSYGKDGFNLTIGGEGKKGCPMSKRAKKIVGEKNRVHNLGKTHSEQTKKRMSLSSPRRKITPEHRAILNKSRIGSKHTKKSRRQMSISHTGQGSALNNKKAAIIKNMLIKGQSRYDISNFMDVSYAVVKSVDTEKAWGHVKVTGWDEYKKEREANKQTRKGRLSDGQVRKIRLLLANGTSQAKISREMGVGNSTISRIKNNKIYESVK